MIIPFYLMRRGRGTPEEISGKFKFCHAFSISNFPRIYNFYKRDIIKLGEISSIEMKIQFTRIEEFKPPLIAEVWRDENSMTAYHNMALDDIPTEHSDFSFLIIDDPLYMQDGEAESIPGKKAVVKYSSTDTEK